MSGAIGIEQLKNYLVLYQPDGPMHNTLWINLRIIHSSIYKKKLVKVAGLVFH